MMRIDFMLPACYSTGSCVLCGCTTTALQMATKSCDKPCYPRLMNKQQWEDFKQGMFILDDKGRWVLRSNQEYIIFYPKDGSQKQLLYPLNKQNL